MNIPEVDEYLFFEILRVSIGSLERLSHAPNEMEWRHLYALAEKQALIGVCFAGVQRLQKLGYNIPTDLYMKWLGMAAKIQQRNELMNRKCVEAQQLLAEEGLKSSILKGQGVAVLYNRNLYHKANLSLLRQSGDIDIYVPSGMEKAMAYAQKKHGKVEYDYINAHIPMFKDVEVELHWRVQSISNLFRNRKLQWWLEKEETRKMILGGKAVLPNGGEITVPTMEFNAFYLMLHCYHHVLESGLGLRQLMDYYFLLLSFQETHGEHGYAEANRLFREFGMERFVGAVMWVMQEVFGLEREGLMCEPDEKEGWYILGEVMAGGNFGHHDERIRKVGKGKWIEVFSKIQHAMHLLRRYPMEALWMPVWMVYHFIWKRTNK